MKTFDGTVLLNYAFGGTTKKTKDGAEMLQLAEVRIET